MQQSLLIYLFLNPGSFGRCRVPTATLRITRWEHGRQQTPLLLDRKRNDVAG